MQQQERCANTETLLYEPYISACVPSILTSYTSSTLSNFSLHLVSFSPNLCISKAPVDVNFVLPLLLYSPHRPRRLLNGLGWWVKTDSIAKKYTHVIIDYPPLRALLEGQYVVPAEHIRVKHSQIGLEFPEGPRKLCDQLCNRLTTVK